MRRSLFRSVESGDLDLVFDDVPPPPVLQRYQDDPAPSADSTTTGSVFFSFATFNLALPPFDDIAVRRAVAFAMDRAAMAETIDPEPRDVAQHFASDTTEASLLASWSTIPGPDGQGDVGAASEAMAESRYASGDRCTDPVCQGVPIVMRDTMRRAVPEFRARLRDLGIDAEITIDPNPHQCLDPEQRIGMCIGMGWSLDYPSADQYIGAFFASDGQLAATRLGAAPKEPAVGGTTSPRYRPSTGKSSAAVRRSEPTRHRAGRGSDRGEPADARGPDRGDQPAATLLVADRLAAVGPSTCNRRSTASRPTPQPDSFYAGRTATQTAPSPSTVRAEGAPSSATDPAISSRVDAWRIVRDVEHATHTESPPTATAPGVLQPLEARSREVTTARIGVQERDPVVGSPENPHAALADCEPRDRSAHSEGVGGRQRGGIQPEDAAGLGVAHPGDVALGINDDLLGAGLIARSRVQPRWS